MSCTRKSRGYPASQIMIFKVSIVHKTGLFHPYAYQVTNRTVHNLLSEPRVLLTLLDRLNQKFLDLRASGSEVRSEARGFYLSISSKDCQFLSSTSLEIRC